MTTPTPKLGMILRELASRKIRESSTGGNLIRTWSASARASVQYQELTKQTGNDM